MATRSGCQSRRQAHEAAQGAVISFGMVDLVVLLLLVFFAGLYLGAHISREDSGIWRR
jgi:hypothetical protein